MFSRLDRPRGCAPDAHGGAGTEVAADLGAPALPHDEHGTDCREHHRRCALRQLGPKRTTRPGAEEDDDRYHRPESQSRTREDDQRGMIPGSECRRPDLGQITLVANL
jgi:hypothetical protein